jgi:hypothetical protein
MNRTPGTITRSAPSTSAARTDPIWPSAPPGHDLSLSHPRVAQTDLAYHDLRRGRRLYGLLERRGAVDRVATDLEIFEAKETPPQTTRAPARRVHPARTGAPGVTSRWTGCTSS